MFNTNMSLGILYTPPRRIHTITGQGQSSAKTSPAVPAKVPDQKTGRDISTLGTITITTWAWAACPSPSPVASWWRGWTVTVAPCHIGLCNKTTR
jgi:hypothetical protein